MTAAEPPSTPPAEAPPTLAAAAASGDRLATLHALRDVLATSIGTAAAKGDGRVVAALARQMDSTLESIEEIEKTNRAAVPPAPGKGSPVDEIKARRAARVANPPRRARA